MYKKISVCIVSALLFGCNSDQLPNDTKVRISPGSKTLAISSVFEEGMFCFTEDGLYQDIPLLINVSDGQDTPLGDAEIGVYADFAANTFNGVEMLQLYRDANGNGVIDGPEELVTSSTSGVYKTKTDKYDGSTMLMLRMYLTCPYSGEVYVFAGTSSTTMNVAVTYQKKQTTSETTGGETTDAGTSDSGAADSGTLDSGTVDAGTVDAGTTDAGTADAGTVDSGASDAGTSDAGTSDAGTSDAGTSDAGTTDFGIADAGTTDTGTTDSGTVDAGTTDAGTSDAGLADAGTTNSTGIELVVIDSDGGSANE